MKTFDIIAGIWLTALIGLIIAWLHSFYMIKVVYPRVFKRIEEVYEFRIWVLNNHYELFESLPSYDEMMEDGKELKLESYIEIPETLLNPHSLK